MDNQLAVDHADLGELLGEVRTALEAGDIKRSHARLDLFWARLAMHIRAEHLHLFPAILRVLSEKHRVNAGATPSLSQAKNAIEELRRDHDFFMHELARAIATMRHLLTSTDQQLAARALKGVQARIVAVEERLATHNALEEGQVYLWTRSLLGDAEQFALAARVQNELANVPPRFADAKTK